MVRNLAFETIFGGGCRYQPSHLRAKHQPSTKIPTSCNAIAIGQLHIFKMQSQPLAMFSQSPQSHLTVSMSPPSAPSTQSTTHQRWSRDQPTPGSSVLLKPSTPSLALRAPPHHHLLHQLPSSSSSMVRIQTRELSTRSPSHLTDLLSRPTTS